MNSGLLPPVPDLIPISALCKSSSRPSGGSDKLRRECAPCSKEVMGEQRPRRRVKNQNAIDLINNGGSRGASAAPKTLPPPPTTTRKTRNERRRKSDRHCRKTARIRSIIGKHANVNSTESRENNRVRVEKPASPRVNPIFVWVRQEDNRIVEVKCEDYDKRNRILLTKTAHGWRAIPRTETLVPTLKASVDQQKQQQTNSQEESQHHHHRHHRRKSRKSKTRQKSAGSQFPEAGRPDSEVGQDETEREDHEGPEVITETTATSPSWVCEGNINVESLLPSHTIHVIKRPTKKRNSSSSPSRDIIKAKVNISAPEKDCAQTPPIKCSAERICDVSPLENLLAVAELEFKQQIQSGEWHKSSSLSECEVIGDDDEDVNDISYDNVGDVEMSRSSPIGDAVISHAGNVDDIEVSRSGNIDDIDMTHSCNMGNNELNHSGFMENMEHEIKEIDKINIKVNDTKIVKSEECDYNEDDDIAMNDILSRLEQSLESPESSANLNIKEEQKHVVEDDTTEVQFSQPDNIKRKEEESGSELSHLDDIPETDLTNCQSVPETKINNVECDTNKFKTAIEQEETSPDVQIIELEPDKHEVIDLIESSTTDEEPNNEQDHPTDLSMKSNIITLQENSCDATDGPTDLSIQKIQQSPNRSPSQNSEAIQSPQPSGIPAVPQSPDIVSISNSVNRSKTIFLESLLTTTAQKISLNSEVTISRQKEPLDLGKCRKSASPTVTCSEEIVCKPINMESEPPTKKFKSADITLKDLLDSEEIKLQAEARRKNVKESPLEMPTLLELLQNENKSTDALSQFKQLLNEIDIPDPLMVPKSSFADLLKHPRREIIKILSEQPQNNTPINEILVVYKDKLMSALQANCVKPSSDNNSIKSNNNANSASHTKAMDLEKSHAIEAQPQLNIPTGILNKSNKRAAESSVKQNNTSSFSESQAQKNILANDIEAATEAAFNQMMWLPYANHLDALNYANNQEVLQALYNTLPLMPDQLGDLHPSLQQMMFSTMMANKMSMMSPVNVPQFPPGNFSNPLEFNMWQEAVMQANLLRAKNPFDNLIANQSLREMQKTTHGGSTSSKKQHLMHNQRAQQQHKTAQQSLHQQNLEQQRLQQDRLQQSLFSQNIPNNVSGHLPGYQNNAYLNVAGYSNSNKQQQSLHIPQLQQPKNKQNNYQSATKQKDFNANFFAQFSEQEKQLNHQYLHSLNQQKHIQNVQKNQQKHHHNAISSSSNQNRSNGNTNKYSSTNNLSNHFSVGNKPMEHLHSTKSEAFKPIDLSGCTPDFNKSKVNLSGIDPQQQQQQQHQRLPAKQSAVPTNSKSYEDMPEVGSTTASIEEMQAAHKQFWHPLFGSVRDTGGNQEDWESISGQQGYPPWSTSSVTATGE